MSVIDSSNPDAVHCRFDGLRSDFMELSGGLLLDNASLFQELFRLAKTQSMIIAALGAILAWRI